MEYVLRELAFEKDMQGLKVLVTAGPTQEAIDPVRFISNHSTGKMGYAIAKNAMLRGAEVTLVTGRTALEPPMFVKNGSRNICKRYVSGGHGMCKRTGHYRKGCGSGRLHTGAYRR